MSDLIKTTAPMANDILVYSEIEGKFINARADMSVLGIELPEYNVVKLSASGQSLVERFQGSTLRTKTLNVGSGLSIAGTSSTVTISLDAVDAAMLGGYSADDFLKVENVLSEINTDALMDRINAYDRTQSHDIFMETNASNIPDKDNTYDLGSNGRRYADVFAVTFHGTATEAIIAHNVRQNGANDGDIMVWRDTNRRWNAEDLLSGFMRNTGLQILPPYGEAVHRPTEPIFNVQDGNVHHYRFTNSRTIELHAPTDGNLYSFTLILEDAQDYSVTFPSDVVWLGGQEPEFSSHDVITAFTIDGVKWICAFAGSFASK